MSSLKVLMMGGRRCGKTSALASLFYQMIHGETKKYLTVADTTTSETKDSEIKETLSNKRLELEYFILKGKNNTFLVDKGPTANYWTYTMTVKIPGTNRKMEITFYDANGEFFDQGASHDEATTSFVQECDIFVVVVDTPYLMAGNKVEAEAANQIDSIHSFLTHIDNQNGRKAKQVIFVPIKCEKWFKEGNIEDVIEAIENYYSATIEDLMASNKTELSIIPILTAGDIIFSDLREPYLLCNTLNGKKKRCAKISDRIVTLENGENHKVTSDELVNEDLDGVFTVGGKPTCIKRPSAWFHLTTDHKATYSPYNCEQLPLHIIRFMFNKKKTESWGGIPGRLISFFGGISAQDMQEALDKLSKNNLIKDSGEGIKIIKKCF